MLEGIESLDDAASPDDRNAPAKQLPKRAHIGQGNRLNQRASQPAEPTLGFNDRGFPLRVNDQAVADGIGLIDLPEPLPKALKRAPKPETTRSDALSLLARPGTEGIKTRRIPTVGHDTAMFMRAGVPSAMVMVRAVLSCSAWRHGLSHSGHR